jgi:transposase
MAPASPYLTLMTEEAPQRCHPLRENSNGQHWSMCSGAPWRTIPNDLLPWQVI